MNFECDHKPKMTADFSFGIRVSDSEEACGVNAATCTSHKGLQSEGHRNDWRATHGTLFESRT